MEPITILSDGCRSIAYDEMIPRLRQWIVEETCEREHEGIMKEQGGWEKSRYCIVDYKDASCAISAANAIRAFMPKIPLLVITDFQSLIRKRHLQQISGSGEVKLSLWHPGQLDQWLSEIQRWLQTSPQDNKKTIPSTMSIRS
ncbi:hypothetical protein [Paenibacillus tundrae]|uniref:Uncharacterized protein n=1 Tax=Paenibacillus tundrae TaxID=528187 RepID=A0ABT9WIT3_9BACL|nr:hypothetical protein [Paenibacillus tundrae]MDQ0173198.1 hypothetical protein [Paenibacillus tundrae]